MVSVLREAFRVAIEPTRRNVLHWTSWVVALAIQCTAVLVLRNGRIFHWEADVVKLAQRVPGRYEIFDGINYSTNTIAWEFVPLFAIVVWTAWLFGERLGAALLVLTFPLHVLAQWPKAVVDRARPPGGFEGLEGIGDAQSFPSGHAEFVITFWGFVAFLAVRRVERTWVRVPITSALVVATVAVGVGRMAIGRHWPLDILVSYVVGLGLLSGLIWLYHSWRAALGYENSPDRPSTSGPRVVG